MPRLGEALETHGAAKIRHLPAPVLVGIFGCTADELPAVLTGSCRARGGGRLKRPPRTA